MHVQESLLARFTQAYIAHRGIRLLGVLLVLSAALLLFLLTDGFPPFAWRLLAQSLFQLPVLMVVHGQVVLLALAGLLFLSLTILLVWLALFWLISRMLAYWWYERQELRAFALDAAEAQYLAKEDDEEYLTHYASAEEEEYLSGDDEVPWHDENEVYAEDDKAEALGIYRDEEEEATLWEEQDTYPVAGSVRPFSSLRVMDVPDYSRQPVGQVAHNSYSHMMPFTHSPAVNLSPPQTMMRHEPASRPTTPLMSTPFSSTPEFPMHSSPIQLVVSTGLDVGIKRRGRPNEDSLLALQNTRVLRGCTCPVGLFVVADGMGGHENGQEASRLVIQSLSETTVPSVLYGPTDDNYAELLAEGVHRANLELYQHNRQEKTDMGTTITAALIVDTTAYVINAGDSRTYLYRASSGLSQVTRDHSTVARLVENGLIQPEDVYTHPRRNEIYRSLGHHPSEDLDSFILALQAGDLLMLCSDGLWEMVRDAEIQQIIASSLPQPAQISAALVQEALEGGGKDNISVIVVYVQALGEAQAACAD